MVMKSCLFLGALCDSLVKKMGEIMLNMKFVHIIILAAVFLLLCCLFATGYTLN